MNSRNDPMVAIIQVYLKSVASAYDVPAATIATVEDIEALLLDDDADVQALSGWNREVFGNKALALKHGRLGLVATPNGLIEVEFDPA